jgi:hypothetical protein
MPCAFIHVAAEELIFFIVIVDASWPNWFGHIMIICGSALM